MSSFAQGVDSDSLLASYVAESWKTHPNIDRMRAMIAVESSRATMNNSWMNPELRAGLMNIPESFDAHADPMTMFQIGAMQQIPFRENLKLQGEQVKLGSTPQRPLLTKSDFGWQRWSR
ncbi:MAG: hypothetical protein IPG71_09255 [bacterium]|nr:hypothetical protein [bacterium]